MPIVIPYVPSTITVHLGAPSADVANVSVSFSDYIKNVASSEVYPTWELSALRANVLAITSFALNRIYTEYYRSRGYEFDITSSTLYDQAFVNGRNFFENIIQIVDDLFNNYLRRRTFVEPLAAQFCNGTTVTCDGLSQWGSQALAKDGYNSVQIVRAYYGENIEVVVNAPMQDLTPSYPGTALRQGSSGPNVVVIQVCLNRISQNYPAIPKISNPNGYFDAQTEQSVRQFQQIFNLAVDGIVGKSTWYQLVMLYVAVTKLDSLQSEGQQFYNISWEYPDAIKEGDAGPKVTHLQYMLAVLAEFVQSIPDTPVNGYFGPETKQAVLAFQRWQGLPQDGTVGDYNWNRIYSRFITIENDIFKDAELFPFRREPVTDQGVRRVQQLLAQLAARNSDLIAPSSNGLLDQQTRRAISRYQSLMRQPVTGRANDALIQNLEQSVEAMRYSATSRFEQFPGYDLSLGKQDPAQEGSQWT